MSPRAVRDEVDRATAAAPQEFRAAFARLVHAEPDARNQPALDEVFRRVYAAFTRRDWELNT